MSKYSVLVDSSVWIEYFRLGNVPKLEKLIQEDLVCINELILTEIGPRLIHAKRLDIWESLSSLETVATTIDWNLIRKYQELNLKNGVNKVGIPDLIISQQVIDQKLTLFSFDKHFKLMQKFLNFDLIGN